MASDGIANGRAGLRRTTKPTSAISAPAVGSTVHGSVTLTGTASDNVAALSLILIAACGGYEGDSDSEETAAAELVTGKALLGMSAPADQWAQRVREVGPGLQARRIFLSDFGASLSLPTAACKAGLAPVISFKTGSYSWAQVAAGRADADLRALATRLANLPCSSFVVIHHEPAKDGPASDWAKMQIHALPLLKSTKVKVGVIGNGWWWSNTAQGYTDAEIAQYIPPALRRLADFIGADTYQGSAGAEGAAPKMVNMGKWARRMGDVKALGVGEFNAYDAREITNATNALAADPMFLFGCVYNNTVGVGTVLTGARLTAFRTALATW